MKPTLSTKEQLEQLDEMDREVLRLLQDNSRISSAELARRVNLSAPGLQKKTKKTRTKRSDRSLRYSSQS